MPTVAFKTLGCRLNQAETAGMAAAFEAAGYQVGNLKTPADVVVVHTCTITRNAESECRRLARSLKRRSPAPIVVLAGCAVEAGAADALSEAGADILAGQEDKLRLPELLARLDPTLPTTQSDTAITLPTFSGARALVKVQDGCDFRCSYCIVPDARGAPRSRPFKDILAEIHGLSDQRGYREIVLTGANVGRYHHAGCSLVDLIHAVEALPTVERIRLSSIEPSTVERDVIECMATSAKLCRTLHLPLQSGDNGILAAMRRRYTREQYLDAAHFALNRIPFLGLGADIVTGFPGETDEAFQQTRRLVEALPFSNLHVFPYSERPGTPAAEMSGSVPVPVRKERANSLIALGAQKRQAFAEQFRDRPVEVLIERLDDQGRGRGWTSQYLDAHVADASQADIGHTVQARVREIETDSLIADRTEPGDHA